MGKLAGEKALSVCAEKGIIPLSLTVKINWMACIKAVSEHDNVLNDNNS